MTQEKEWEREYKRSKFLTKENKPQADAVRFVSFLRRQKFDAEKPKVLDLGCGTGRNSYYFAEHGAKVSGMEISRTAIDLAKQNAEKAGFNIDYKKLSIGETFPYENSEFDIALDVTSSNSLSESEREIFLIETHRVLKNGGYFFTKALCKDGDENAKNLIKKFPGSDKDTYILPDIGVKERVWSKEDFVSTYEKYFQILHMEKKTSYTRMNERSYKRNFWIVYMKKA